MIRIQCSGCGKFNGSKRAVETGISHSICDTCFPKLYGDAMFNRIKALRDAR